MPYQFTVEDYTKFIDDIIEANGDQAKTSTILADMQGTIVENIGIKANLEKERDDVKAENDRLKSANMELMMRLGQKAMAETNETKEEPKARGENVDAFLDDFFKEDGNR
ncbi:MAG: hypothetical protein [Podoviridae sp. ctbd591]|nr:MAG: hypothetical protein [Podoviridae sp. ctbd591]